MSISLRNQTTGILERAAGFSDTDAVLSPTSRNPIQNKAVYDALAQKIEKTVTDLENYYNTSQTYNKQEVRDLIGSINTLTIEVVATLPTQDISSTTIYFVGPKAGTTSTYDEYIYVNGTWVQIGDTTIDLSNYVTSANLTTVLQSYYTKTQTDNLFNDYYDKDTIDDLLDAKQDVLEWDNIPTSGSSNPVTSNGIRTAISNAIVSSAGGSIIKVHHLDGGVVAGDTVTASKGSFSVSATFDNNGDAIITGVGEIGTIQVTATNGTDIGVAFINTPSFSLYSTTISYGVNYKSWLEAGGLNPSSYSSLDEVLEDEEAIRRLFTIHASVDYLVAAIITDDNEDAIKIFNNDLCAKWISLRDYAMDTLPTNEHIATMMEDADKYGYGEWALMPQVPIMTSNTAPYGEVVVDTSNYSTVEGAAWHIFDNDITISRDHDIYLYARDAITANSKPFSVGYKFKIPTTISKIKIYAGTNGRAYEPRAFKYQYLNSSNIWVDLTNEIVKSFDGELWGYVTNFEPIEVYGVRIYVTQTGFSGNDAYSNCTMINEMIVYGWQPKGNIPVMTSDTAPYGEVIKTDISSSYNSYYAFNQNTNGQAWLANGSAVNVYIGYKFTNPIKVTKYDISATMINDAPSITSRMKKYKIQASNDNSTWVDVTEEMTYSGTRIGSTTYGTKEVGTITKNEGYYLYYRAMILFKDGSSLSAGLHSLQFYGREMKASVPVMTSNTTPYGEAFGTGPVSSSYDFYHAFDNTSVVWQGSSSGSGSALGEYIGFKNPHPFVIKQLKLSGGTFNGTNAEFTLKGSNDNINYTSITSFNVASGYSSELTVSFDNNIAYSNHILECTNAGGGTTAIVGALQFFGFDYSEYDWDTEYPRHYIYDHGVELEPITYYTNGGTCENDGESIYAYNTAAHKSIAYTNIDLTDYSFIRTIAGDTLTGCLIGIANGKPESESGSSDWTLISYAIYSPVNTLLPYNMYLDCSLINDVKYIGVGRPSSGSYKNKVTEFWLE